MAETPSKESLERAKKFTWCQMWCTCPDASLALEFDAIRRDTFDEFWDYIAANYNIPSGKYTPVELIQSLDKSIRRESNEAAEKLAEACNLALAGLMQPKAVDFDVLEEKLRAVLTAYRERPVDGGNDD